MGPGQSPVYNNQLQEYTNNLLFNHMQHWSKMYNSDEKANSENFGS